MTNMKKRILFYAVCLITAFSASFAAQTSDYTTDSPSKDFQVCQFSLSRYSGTLSSNGTDEFTVGLSCPQDNVVYATVKVKVDDKVVASKVVKIEAGTTESGTAKISVSGYSGKPYTLEVN